MRPHVVVATLSAALASLVLTASAAACQLTDLVPRDINGPIEPGQTVSFTFSGLQPSATYTVTFADQPIKTTEVRRDPNGAEVAFKVPDLGAATAEPRLLVQTTGNDGDGKGEASKDMSYRDPKLAPTQTPAAGEPAPTPESSQPTSGTQPTSTPQPAAAGSPPPAPPSGPAAGPPQGPGPGSPHSPTPQSPSGSPGHVTSTPGYQRHGVIHIPPIRARVTPAVAVSAPSHARRVAKPARSSIPHTVRATSPPHGSPATLSRRSLRARHVGGAVLVALVVLSALLVLGLIGLGGTRVLARRRTPIVPQPSDAPTPMVVDSVEAELQAMLEEERALTAAKEVRELVPL